MGKVIMSGIVPQLVKPTTGIMASDLAVGSIVKLMENGSPVEYLVVHNGLPSSMYDASCDGLWLLRKDCYESRQWHSSNNSYKASMIHSYLNDTFLGLFDPDTQAVIQQAKIPYGNGNGSSAVSSGSSGLSAKIFLLSVYEAGWTESASQYFPQDGTCLFYFSGTAFTDSKRNSYLNGNGTIWWLRSPNTSTTDSAWAVLIGGSCGNYHYSRPFGIRPALILPSNAIFDADTMILKGVS